MDTDSALAKRTKLYKHSVYARVREFLGGGR